MAVKGTRTPALLRAESRSPRTTVLVGNQWDGSVGWKCPHTLAPVKDFFWTTGVSKVVLRVRILDI